MNELDERFMREALLEAQKAFDILEVPVGCVLVKDGEIIARGFNQRETSHHVFQHAEMIAIDEACKKLNSWRLDECTLYVTLEPCVMCAGTMIQARLKRLVYGADEPKSGAHHSIINVFDPNFNHVVTVEAGVLAKEAGEIMKSFFRKLRTPK